MEHDAYRRYASIYDRLYEPVARRLREAGLRLLSPRKNISILDVCCGTGTQLALYKIDGCRLVGIDLSPSMLDVARQKLGQDAELRQEDATHMSFPGGSFDLVTMVLSLHEMPSNLRPAVLRECMRVVASGGSIMLMDFHNGPYPFPRGWLWKSLLTIMEISMGRAHFANYRDFLAHGALEGLIAEQGFAIQKRFVFESGVAAVYVVRR